MNETQTPYATTTRNSLSSPLLAAPNTKAHSSTDSVPTLSRCARLFKLQLHNRTDAHTTPVGHPCSRPVCAITKLYQQLDVLVKGSLFV